MKLLVHCYQIDWLLSLFRWLSPVPSQNKLKILFACRNNSVASTTGEYLSWLQHFCVEEANWNDQNPIVKKMFLGKNFDIWLSRLQRSHTVMPITRNQMQIMRIFHCDWTHVYSFVSSLSIYPSERWIIILYILLWCKRNSDKNLRCLKVRFHFFSWRVSQSHLVETTSWVTFQIQIQAVPFKYFTKWYFLIVIRMLSIWMNSRCDHLQFA